MTKHKQVQPTVHTNTHAHLWQYLAELSFELEMFQKNVKGNKTTDFISKSFNRKSCLFRIAWTNMVDPHRE
jgi:hypothetical protein